MKLGQNYSKPSKETKNTIPDWQNREFKKKRKNNTLNIPRIRHTCRYRNKTVWFSNFPRISNSIREGFCSNFINC